MGTSITSQFGLNFNINRYNNSPLQISAALNTFRSVSFGNDNFSASASWSQQTQINAGQLPPPRMSQAGPPAGRGLATGEEGWPKGTTTTAGGYHVVPEGNTNWSIYAPGQEHGEKAHTRIWGDPHVSEKDGTRWDFTKDSDFVLGDGTRIAVDTSSETGKSVTKGLDITNGADHVTVSNVNGKPTTSGVKNDGYEWRAAHIASNPNRDSFHLRGDKEHVHWMKETGGQMQGVVTGAHYDAKTNRYEQEVDPTLRAGLAPGMRPPFGSAAWGNKFRGQLNDRQAQAWGQALGPIGAWPAVMNAMGIHGNHNMAQLFGGWGNYFDSPNTGFNSIQMMTQLLHSDAQWRSQMAFGVQAGISWN